MTCYKCSRGRGERNKNFRDDCPDGIRYLPQVHTLDDGFDYDTGDLYVCSGGCVQWLVAKAHKQGLQTKVVQYSLSAYQKCGQQSWIPAKIHSYQFITAACDEEDERKAAKTAKKSKPRKHKRGKSPTPSAGAAIPTALPPQFTTVPQAPQLRRLPTWWNHKFPAPQAPQLRRLLISWNRRPSE